MAYRLALPPTAKIHPVFHVSQLRKVLGHASTVLQLPPTMTDSLVMECQPEHVLGIRNMKAGSSSDSEVLIKWTGLPESEATWEQFCNIADRFPDFHLEDKVALLGGGNAKNVKKPPTLITYKRKQRSQGQGRDINM